MFIAFFILGAVATLLCYACLVEGAKADEYTERQYQEYLRKNNYLNRND